MYVVLFPRPSVEDEGYSSLPTDVAGIFLSHKDGVRGPPPPQHTHKDSIPGNRKGWAGLWDFKVDSLAQLAGSFLLCHFPLSYRARLQAAHPQLPPTIYSLILQVHSFSLQRLPS